MVRWHMENGEASSASVGVGQVVNKKKTPQMHTSDRHLLFLLQAYRLTAPAPSPGPGAAINDWRRKETSRNQPFLLIAREAVSSSALALETASASVAA